MAAAPNGMHGALLQIDPGQPGTPEVFAIGIDPMSVTSGQTVRGTVGLVQPAPAGGATVFLSSSDPAAQVPSSVNIAAGNSANSFTITTSSVINFTSANIVASTSGTDTTKSAWLTIFPDPNADVVLLSVTPSVERHDRRQQHSCDALPQRQCAGRRSRRHADEQQHRCRAGACQREHPGGQGWATLHDHDITGGGGRRR